MKIFKQKAFHRVSQRRHRETQGHQQLYSLWFSVSPLWFFVFLLFLISCQSDLLNPPRLATATAQSLATATPTPEPIIIRNGGETAVSASQTTISGTPTPRPSLTVWVPETSAAHRQMLDQLAADFGRDHAVNVEMQLIAPNLLPKLVNTAVLSGTLPDIIIHPVSLAPGWAAEGILNADAASETIAQLGAETFDPAALALVAKNGRFAAIPSDGAKQLIIYRRDWFEQRNLQPPDSYNRLLSTAETLFNRDALVAGFVVPTESNLIATHKIFEQLANANGCNLIDEKGEVLLLSPECQQALDFYFSIISQYSPLGVQTDTSTRNAYLEGRAGLIMTPPTLLLDIAGLGTDKPSCAECASQPDFLQQNSAFLTTVGTNGSYSDLTVLGITSVAPPETAVSFATYFFNEGYEQWLAVESERKVPLRWGTAVDPRRHLDSWGSQPVTGSGLSLRDLYGEEAIAQLRDNVAATSRWGLPQGQGEVVTQLYESLTLSIVLQEMLSGYFNSSQTLQEMYNRVTGLIPNYQYYPDPTPTPEG